MHTGIDTAVFFDWKNLDRRFIRSLSPIQGLLTEIKPAKMKWQIKIFQNKILAIAKFFSF